jgi:hypothetical protein
VGNQRLTAWAMGRPEDHISWVYDKWKRKKNNFSILKHVDPLLGNDCEINKYTGVFTE